MTEHDQEMLKTLEDTIDVLGQANALWNKECGAISWAIQKLRKLLGDNVGSIVEPIPMPDAEAAEKPYSQQKLPYGGLAPYVRSMCEVQDGEFTMPQILKLIQVNYPRTLRNSVWSCIRNLVNAGFLEVVTPGEMHNTQKPAIYRRVTKENHVGHQSDPGDAGV